jgi:hypothetical protein
VLPAADLAVFDADFDASVLLAARAADALVRSLDPRWVSALPAADLTDFDEDFAESARPAALAALLPVRRPAPMIYLHSMLRFRFVAMVT